MKIIDLLNKIANGEEVPKKIKIWGELFELQEIRDGYKIYKDEHLDYLFGDDYDWECCLNDEIEIIEEPKEELEEIDKIQYYYKNTYGNISQHKKSETDIIDKINELIESQNNMIKKIKEVEE